MISALRIIDAAALLAIRPETVIASVRRAIIQHAQGLVVAPPPLQMVFAEANGDLHVKTGYVRGGNTVVIKVASGFYDNPTLGLPVNNGLLLVLDSRTGEPVALINDHGLLTGWRTAAAGALAAQAGALPGTPILGIIGTGHQARLQAEWTARHLGLVGVRVLGRSADRAAALVATLRAGGLEASVASSLDALCAECRLIMTCTASSEPIITAKVVRAGTHIVAIGADMHGKQELDPALFGIAECIMVDDRQQCADHGDLSHAVGAGIVSPMAARGLGDVLASPQTIRCDGVISIADLTGIAATDVEMAELALGCISSPRIGPR